MGCLRANPTVRRSALSEGFFQGLAEFVQKLVVPPGRQQMPDAENNRNRPVHQAEHRKRGNAGQGDEPDQARHQHAR